MAYIYYNKKTNQYRLFGSLPVMCKSCDLYNPHLDYHFSRLKNTEYENETVKIIKVRLERGGKNK
jgi:hypothetical protein